MPRARRHRTKRFLALRWLCLIVFFIAMVIVAPTFAPSATNHKKSDIGYICTISITGQQLLDAAEVLSQLPDPIDTSETYHGTFLVGFRYEHTPLLGLYGCAASFDIVPYDVDFPRLHPLPVITVTPETARTLLADYVVTNGFNWFHRSPGEHLPPDHPIGDLISRIERGDTQYFYGKRLYHWPTYIDALKCKLIPWRPYLIAAATLSLITFTSLTILARRMRTPRECPNCSYDLAGLPLNAICPECGTPTPHNERVA